MKKKGAGMVMTIMLVALCGWVAIVVFVIKPDIVAGAFLCIAGGGTIGLIIAYLMWRWWFRGIPKRRWPDPSRVTLYKEFDFGEILRTNLYSHRYACAGEDLKKGTLVEANLSGRLIIGELPESKEINELVYGDVRSTTKVNKHGFGILGWPVVDVKKNHYCWLQEPPMGAEFEKEE